MSRQAGIVKAVVGILCSDNKVLVAERPEGKPYSGYWEFPGGKIESLETSEDALRRELMEELGIGVKRMRHWFEHQHAYPDKIVLLDMWLVDEFIGEPCGKENQQLRWASLADILDLRLLEGNWPIIDKIKTLF